MTSPITTAIRDGVLVITSNNPPVNAISTAVRTGLIEAIEAAEQDQSVAACVIIGEGQTFFAGADVKEFGQAPVEPLLPTVVDRIEACSKPVLAAIHGTALGGGLEIAMACHYRLAVPSAKLGLPEVKLGLMPGAGGTQRLPRLVGVPKALEMITSGSPIGAREALDIGLIDRLAEGDLLEEAEAFARECSQMRPLPRSSQSDAKLADARVRSSLFDEFRRANARKFQGFEAPDAILQAIKTAVTLPYSEGVQEERSYFSSCAAAHRRRRSAISSSPSGKQERSTASARK